MGFNGLTLKWCGNEKKIYHIFIFYYPCNRFFSFLALPLLAASNPVVSSVSPIGGPLVGSTTITITGSGFIDGATVSIGGVSATNVIFGSSTSLTAITPAGTGAQSVVVTNPDTQSSNTNITFTYAAAPTVTAITPSSGLNSGSLNISNLQGTGFLPGATVQLQKSGQTSISGTSVSVVGPTQITCTFNRQEQPPTRGMSSSPIPIPSLEH